MLDLLIIIPSGRKEIFQSLDDGYAAIEPPTWALLIANYLRLRGWQIGFYDFETVNYVEPKTYLKETRSVLVHVHGSQPSASTQNMPAAIALCQSIKTIYPKLPLFISGSHPAALPEQTRKETGADVVIGGEGYTEIHRLLTNLGNPDLSIIKHPPIDPVLVPIAAWDLIDAEKYRSHNWHSFTNNLDRSRYGAIYTSFSCPFACGFCLQRGSEIATAKGPNRKIQNIKVGEQLLAYDEKERKLVETTVSGTHHRVVEEILEITLSSGERIRATGEHPFFTNRGWIEARNLSVGDSTLIMAKGDKRLYAAQHSPHFVEIVSIENYRGQFTVYNLECTPYDNFFAERFLVHNCMIHSPYGGAGHGHRLLPVARVVEEIGILVERYGVNNLKIIDEMFLLNRAHVTGICQGIIKHGWKLNTWAYARVDTCRDIELLNLCKEAGINWLALGIESADESVRDGVDKEFTNDRIYENCERVRDAGINIVGNFIVGLPNDNYESMEATLEMAEKIMPEWLNIYPAMAYPGSKLYAEARKAGQSLPDSWLGYSMHSYETFPLSTKYLSPANVLRFRDEAFNHYYSNTQYQVMVWRKFGVDVKAHIQEMLTHKLKRRLLGD